MARIVVPTMRELDAATVAELVEDLQRCGGHGPCIVDLGAVTFCDCRAIGALIAHARAHRSGTVRVINADAPGVRLVFDALDVHAILAALSADPTPA